MKPAALSLLLLLSACGGGDIDRVNNHGYGYEYDYITPSGVRVIFADGVNESYKSLFSPEMIEAEYRAVMACMARFASGPIVVVAADDPALGDYGALIYLDTGTIVISQDLFWATSILRHEYVHYLLSVSGFPRARNIAHDSEYFVECAQG